MKHQLKIRKSDGLLEFLGDPPIGFSMANPTKRRFSEIVPVNPFLLAAFRILRFLFGEKGIVSDWTRGWRCTWRMTVLQGNKRGLTVTSNTRSLLIDLEKEAFFDGIGRIINN